MSELQPATIEECCAKKRQFMRLLSKEQESSDMAQVYEAAIRHLDQRSGRIFRSKEQEKSKSDAKSQDEGL